MTFKVGQKVVYPNHGVCLVEEISTHGFPGTDQEQELFVLRLLSNNSKVMVPRENLELVGLRPLCSKQEIEALFGILENGDIDTYKDWKGRYKQNLDKMKTGQLTEVAEVLKNLCLVSQKKSLSFREKKMFERAKFFIVSEVAHVQDITEAESETRVEGLLDASLEKLRQSREEERVAKEKKEAKELAAKDAKDARDAKREAAKKAAASPAKSASAKSSKSAAAKKPATKAAAGKASSKTAASKTAPRNGKARPTDEEARPNATAFEKEPRLEASVA